MDHTNVLDTLAGLYKAFSPARFTNNKELNKKINKLMIEAQEIGEPLVVFGQNCGAKVNTDTSKTSTMLVNGLLSEIENAGKNQKVLAFEIELALSPYLSKPLALSPYLSKPIKDDVEKAMMKYVKDRGYVEPETDGQDD